jgi:hypothetical protein
MINDYLRLKEVRKSLKLTLADFGKKLGVRDSTISSIETGKNALTDQMIKSVCAIYKVNEDWLRNGTGEMFINDDSLLDSVKQEYDFDDIEIDFIKSYSMLNKSEQAVFRKFLKNYVKKFEQNQRKTSSVKSEKSEKISDEVSNSNTLEITAEKVGHINIKHK